MSTTEQFVPHDWIFSVFENQNSYGELIHTLLFMLFSEVSFAVITLGIGKHFLEEVNTNLEKNKENWRASTNDRYTFLKDKLIEEEANWKRANNHFHDIFQTSWNQHIQSELQQR